MSSTSSQLRLLADLKEIAQNPPEGCSASPATEDNIFLWAATIFGPQDTPWEGGVFSLRLTFATSYPARPPKVRFVTEIFHPNVYSDGSLCLDIIQDAWSPIHTVSTLLTSIQSLLTDPNTHSPANPDAAHLYNTNRPAYNRRVRSLAAKSVEG